MSLTHPAWQTVPCTWAAHVARLGFGSLLQVHALEELSYMLQRLLPQHHTKWGDGSCTCRLGCCLPDSSAWSTRVPVTCCVDAAGEGAQPAAGGGHATGSSGGSSTGGARSSAPSSPGGPSQPGVGRGSSGKGGKGGSKQQGPKAAGAPGHSASAGASQPGTQVPAGSSRQQLMSVSEVLTQLFTSKLWLFARLCVWLDRAEQRSAGTNVDKILMQQHALCLSDQLLAEPPRERLHDRPGMCQLLSPLKSVHYAVSQVWHGLLKREIGALTLTKPKYEYTGLQSLVSG